MPIKAQYLLLFYSGYSQIFWSSFAASENNGTYDNSTDEQSLINTIASSDQLLSVITDSGDHVLKLSFLDSSPIKQSLFSHKRYSVHVELKTAFF